MSAEWVYLVIRADRYTTLRKRRPGRLGSDEVAVPIRVTYPDGWGRIQNPVDIAVPDLLPSVDVPEQPTPSAEEEPE